MSERMSHTPRRKAGAELHDLDAERKKRAKKTEAPVPAKAETREPAPYQLTPAEEARKARMVALREQRLEAQRQRRRNELRKKLFIVDRENAGELQKQQWGSVTEENLQRLALQEPLSAEAASDLTGLTQEDVLLFREIGQHAEKAEPEIHADNVVVLHPDKKISSSRAEKQPAQEEHAPLTAAIRKWLGFDR